MTALDSPDPEGTEMWQIRPFRTFDEFRACVALQEQVWGEGFSERVPVAILKVSQRLGGIAAGAWDEWGELAGFVFGLTGVRDGEVVHWSDMLAVRPELRDAGLGSRLKWYQRRVLLEAGIRRVYWTFDPLESRNAYLNLERLGAVAREYEPDMYGDSDSPLHAGLGTDRLIALWELDAPRVESRHEGREAGESQEEGRPGEEAPEPVPALEATGDSAGAGSGEGLPRPGRPVQGLDARALSVTIPSGIQELKARDPELAREWRLAVRTVLMHYLSRGWEVSGLRRSGNLSRYVLVRYRRATRSRIEESHG